MKLLIIPILLLLSSCATTSQAPPVIVPDAAVVAPVATQEVSHDLFSEAHRCEGTVKYQAEMQNDNMRSRLTCEWEVSPDEWGSWE